MMDKRSIKDDLNLMQTAYAVALVLGFRNVIESLYDMATSMGFVGRIHIIKLLSGILLLLTIIRFFWALGNIQRFIARNESKLKNTRRYVVSLHFFILLLHAFALFALTKFSLGITAQSEVDYVGRFFVFGYTCFLLFNSLWLTVLIWGQGDKYPEKTWILNNAIMSFVALVIYAAVCTWLGNCFAGFVCAVSVFVANCFIDLLKTSSSYVTIGEKEKKESPTS